MPAERVSIEVWADWDGLGGPVRMGQLHGTRSRGKHIFSFEYDREWLTSGHAQQLDPSMRLDHGVQYAAAGRDNFGVFLDSSPDRWGRVLMDRREAQLARVERRRARRLDEVDYLLGVYDGHRLGALRYRIGDGPFLDDNTSLASPPWTSLRELEQASLHLEQEDAERDPAYGEWLRLLLAPGRSLGGARPKASVVDERGQSKLGATHPLRLGDDAARARRWRGRLELPRPGRADHPRRRQPRARSRATVASRRVLRLCVERTRSRRQED